MCYTVLTSAKFCNLISSFFFLIQLILKGKERTDLYHCENASLFSESLHILNAVFMNALLYEFKAEGCRNNKHY